MMEGSFSGAAPVRGVGRREKKPVFGSEDYCEEELEQIRSLLLSKLGSENICSRPDAEGEGGL